MPFLSVSLRNFPDSVALKLQKINDICGSLIRHPFGADIYTYVASCVCPSSVANRNYSI